MSHKNTVDYALGLAISELPLLGKGSTQHCLNVELLSKLLITLPRSVLFTVWESIKQLGHFVKGLAGICGFGFFNMDGLQYISILALSHGLMNTYKNKSHSSPWLPRNKLSVSAQTGKDASQEKAFWLTAIQIQHHNRRMEVMALSVLNK